MQGTDCIAGKNTQHIMCFLAPYFPFVPGILHLPLFRNSHQARGVAVSQRSSCFCLRRDGHYLLCALHNFWKKQWASKSIVPAV